VSPLPVTSIYSLPGVVTYLPQHVWKLCFLCRQTNSLVFTDRWVAGCSCWFRAFSAELKNTSICTTLQSFSALEVFYIIVLYKSTFSFFYEWQIFCHFCLCYAMFYICLHLAAAEFSVNFILCVSVYLLFMLLLLFNSLTLAFNMLCSFCFISLTDFIDSTDAVDLA